jgi:hypothetical protein
MTPGYASPEQVRGEAVTTATDIYSLGAVLYELLTGRRAHSIETDSPAALERAICERDPRPPSDLVQDLDPDLDNIVLMALRKEPARRYASVEELSDDLARFLENRPIKARKESLAYRGRKFVKRKRALIAAAAASAALMLAIITGLGRIDGSHNGTRSVATKKDDRWDHLKFEKIATLGDPAPGGGVFTQDFEPLGFNNRGEIAFVSEVSADTSLRGSSPESTGEAVFLFRRELPPLSLARPGQPAPGGGVFQSVCLGRTSLNDSGEVAFGFALNPPDPPELKGFVRGGLYRYSPGDQKLSVLVVPGVTPAPGFGVFESIGWHAGLNNSSEIVFAGVIRTTAGLSSTKGLGQGIFVANHNGQFSKVVAPGDRAPGEGVFDFAVNPSINDRGDVVFSGHLAGEECINLINGPACGESIYFKSAASGRLVSIAHQGEQTPISGISYRYAWSATLNNSGDLMFMGELPPPSGVRAARGAFLYSRGATTTIAAPGDIMPDGRKIVTVNPSQASGSHSLNNHGDAIFNAALEDGGSGLYVYSRGLSHLIAETGRVIPGIGAISSVSNVGQNLNDNGQILFQATMTDGKNVLLLATPEPPPPQAPSRNRGSVANGA